MFIEISKEEFSKKVEDRVSVKNCSYIDAVIYILEENSLDVSLSSKFLTKPIIEKLQEEGQKMNILSKKNKTLPFA
jgi:hypothetical protein